MDAYFRRVPFTPKEGNSSRNRPSVSVVRRGLECPTGNSGRCGGLVRLQTTIERGATSPWRVFLSFRADCLDVRGRRRRRRERQKRRLHPQVLSLGLSRGGKCTFLHLTRYSAPARPFLPYTRTFRDQRSANVFLPPSSSPGLRDACHFGLLQPGWLLLPRRRSCNV